MKKLRTLLIGAALTTVMVIPAFAAEMRARVKAVDADKGIVTVVEGHKDYNLAANAETRFLNAKGGSLAHGVKSGDLKEGRRVVVNYDDKNGALVLTSLKIRK